MSTSPMHIGFLQAYFTEPGVGGGELHTEQLSRALADRGHRVTVFTDRSRRRRAELDDLDIREYSTLLKRNPVNELVLAQQAWDDLLECDAVTLTDESAWRGVDLPRPTVMVFHLVWHGWVNRYRPFWQVLRRKPQAFLYRHLEHKICREADAIVAISPNIREDIDRVGNFDYKLREIPNGVDTDRFHPAAAGVDDGARKDVMGVETDPVASPDASDDTGEERFIVHFQGRLVAMKQPDVLVEAVAASTGDWTLTVGGDGPLRPRLKRRVDELGVDERVDLLGYVPDESLPARYASSDVFCLPSRYEGMPLTVLEAAACGTPAVVSPRAATDFVTEETGRVVEPVPNRLAAVLDGLSANPATVERLGRAARERAEGYDWAVVAERYERLYRDLDG